MTAYMSYSIIYDIGEEPNIFEVFSISLLPILSAGVDVL